MSAPDRRAKLDRDHPRLSVRRQCAMLGVARSGVYRLPSAANDDDLALLRRIDELFTRWPFLGSRRMAAMLRAEGQAINRKRVQRLMRRMGIAALGPKPRTTKPAPGHTIFPYLLRDMTVERPNQSLPPRRRGSGRPTSVCRSKRRERWGLAPRNRLAGAGCKPP
jgi:putative transposase